MAKKPTGFTGSLRIGRNADGAVAELRPVNWPREQSKIELQVLTAFIREFEKYGAAVLGIEPRGTQDLDFLLTLPGGKAYLELMEIVVPRDGELPYQSGNHSYFALPYANKVYSGIQRKAEKYGDRHEIPIDLL